MSTVRDMAADVTDAELSVLTAYVGELARLPWAGIGGVRAFWHDLAAEMDEESRRRCHEAEALEDAYDDDAPGASGAIVGDEDDDTGDTLGRDAA